MNIKAFKKLIKEAVIDAIHEELPYILEEHMARQEKKALREGRTMSFSSADVMTGAGDPNIRASLRSKMGEAFGFSQPQQASPLTELKVIDDVDESTGEKVNPFLAFIADSANNMTPQERAGLKNLG
jgi:hypothetical protein